MTKKNRTLVIGDIHGGLKALIKTMLKVNYDHTKDTLVFLGDYVDGWSQSAQVVERLIFLKNQSPDRVKFIKGNHDEWTRQWLNEGKANPIWVAHGGRGTMNSYINTGLITSEEHKEFFNNLLDYYIDDKNNLFVHGGFTSRSGVAEEKYKSTLYFDRTLWESAMLGPAPADGPSHGRRSYLYNEVFIGHTPTTNWKCKTHYPEYLDDNQEKKNGDLTVPMNRRNIWNLDTGCGWAGKLTIMDIDTKEYWQSDLIKTLYPYERGR